ncbi:hypothetical protein [Enterobacter kobei]|uniref:hypothetical protein n=1 Tax=Enterobacter kobei TaxID=208224 RepID=UPI002FD2E84C
MTSFNDFKEKRAQVKLAIEKHDEQLRSVFREFMSQYIASFDFPGESFVDGKGNQRKYVSILSKGILSDADSLNVHPHDGITVSVNTVLDDSSKNDIRVESFTINIRLVNGLITFVVTGMGFFDEKTFSSVSGKDKYLDVIDYIKSVFLDNILKDYPGSNHSPAE